jgi:hypothetical protein
MLMPDSESAGFSLHRRGDAAGSEEDEGVRKSEKNNVTGGKSYGAGSCRKG